MKHITDDQLREMRDANMLSPAFSEKTRPEHATLTAWRLFLDTDCMLALGDTLDSSALSEHANRMTQDAARVRCAEVYARWKVEK